MNTITTYLSTQRGATLKKLTMLFPELHRQQIYNEMEAFTQLNTQYEFQVGGSGKSTKVIRTNYNPLKQLSVAQAAYIAGLFDGEGHIGLVLGRSQGKLLAAVNVCITNTNLDLHNWLLKVTNIGYLHERTKQGQNNVKAYDWKLNQLEIRQLFPYVAQFLVIKQRQATIIYNYCMQDWSRIPRNKKLEYRKAVYIECRSLNRRGLNWTIDPAREHASKMI